MEYIENNPAIQQQIQDNLLKYDKRLFYWRFEMKVRALPMPNAGGNTEVSHFRVYTRVPILKFIVKRVVPVIGHIISGVVTVLEYVPTTNKKFNSPAGYMFIDGVAGGTLLSEDVLPLGSIGLGSSNYPTKAVCFIPVPSALDVPATQENFAKSFNSGYFGGSTDSQVQKFLTQEYSFHSKPNNVGNYWSHNREHDASPTARMALWMYRTIVDNPSTDPQSDVDICQRACPPNINGSISVPANICSTTHHSNTIWHNIVFNNPDGLAYTWRTSEYLQIRQNNGIWQVSAMPRRSGNAWIEVLVQTSGGCTIPYFRQSVWIGVPSTPSAPIYVDWSLSTTNSPTLYVCPNEWVGFNLLNASILDSQGITHYEWAFSCGTIDNTINTGLVSMTAQIANGQTPCGDVRVRAVNACGASGWLIVDTEYGGNCNNLYSMRQNTEVFSNPADTETNVQIKNLPNVDYNQNNENIPAGFAYQIEVYNKQGVLMKTLETDKVRQKVVTSDLPKGQYQVIIKRGNLVVNKHLIVNR